MNDFVGRAAVAAETAFGRIWAVRRMLSRRDRAGLFVAVLLMAAAAWCSVQIPISLGELGTNMEANRRAGGDWGLADSEPALAALAACFLVRELLHVVRSNLVHGTMSLSVPVGPSG